MKTYAAYALVNGKAETYDDAQKKLASYVEFQMIKGWMPQGGVIFVGLITERDTTNFVFCQAIFKPARPEGTQQEQEPA